MDNKQRPKKKKRPAETPETEKPKRPANHNNPGKKHKPDSERRGAKTQKLEKSRSAVHNHRPEKNRHKKRRKKKYEVGRFRINIAAAAANIAALLISLVYILALVSSSFTIPKLAVLFFIPLTAIVLIISIFAFHITQHNKLPVTGHLLGGLASMAMLIYPAWACIPAVPLYGASIYFLLQKRRYLVSPKRKELPFYKNPVVVAALIAAIALGGSQAVLAMRNDDTPEPRTQSSSESSSQAYTWSRESSVSESESSTEASSSATEESSTETTESQAPEQEEENSSNSENQRTGEFTGITVKLGDISELSTLSGENPMDAQEDSRFVVIQVTVTNQTNEALDFYPESLMLVDPSNNEYPLAPNHGVEGALQSVNIAARSNTSGSIAFELPSSIGMEGLKLFYIGEFAGGDNEYIFDAVKDSTLNIDVTQE